MTEKFGIKVIATAAEIDLLDFIPVFHRWIQTQALDDLLLDVADYSHVHHGPGILLVAHEGKYAVDETGGEGGGLIGVVYSVEGSMDDPEVSVNPLSALAPGFLRGLFEIDTGAGAGDEQEANRFSPSLYPEGVEGLR